MESTCAKCGKHLPEIKYVYPTTHPLGQVPEHERRPPLCRPCWEKATS